LLGGEGTGCACTGEEDINLERNQFGRKRGKPLELPLGRSVFDHEVAAVDVAEVTQSLEEGLAKAAISGQVDRQIADSSDPFGLLSLSAERRGERTGQRGQQEAAAVHH
jgi:hypothetical protein